MTLLDDPPTPVDRLDADLAWLASFEPDDAAVPDLERARGVLRGVRSFVEAMGVRVDAALQARIAPRPGSGSGSGSGSDQGGGPAPRRRGRGSPRPAPGEGSSADAARRRAAAEGVARAPSFAAALARGEVSLDHVAAVGRVRNHGAIRAAEPALLAAACVRSADEFATWLRAWDDACDRARGADVDELRRQRRSLTFFDAELGNGGARVTLTPRQYALLRDAVFAMSDELWRASGDRSSTMQQRLADALVELVARGAGRTTSPSSPDAPATRASQRRPTMLVIIRHEDLMAELEAAGHATTHDGVPIGAAEARRMACNADLLPVVLGGNGVVLDAGQRRRFASDAQWALLLGRDGGCVVGGCPSLPHWCEAHHATDFPKGGRTSLDEMWVACGHHHGLAHAEGWRSEVRGAEVLLWRRDGTPIPTRNARGPVALPPPRPPNVAESS